MVKNKNKLLGQFRVLLNQGTELRLYRELAGSLAVTAPAFRGNRRLMNVYLGAIRELDKAKRTRSRADYVAFVERFKPVVRERIQDASAAFMEAVAIDGMAVHKNALEAGFERLYGEVCVVAVPDIHWKKTAQEAIAAGNRFSEAVERVIDASADDDKWPVIVADKGNAFQKRMANEAYLAQSRAGQRVQQYAGVSRYIWHTMRDLRVVGNPAGYYPVGHAGHEDHWSREGKVFAWSEPPSDGHPGEAFGCRCQAIPLLALNNPEIS